MYSVDFSIQGGGDENATETAIRQIKKESPDFVFIHLDDIDHAGHAVGFGDAYKKSVKVVDRQIGELLQTISHKEQNNNEKWLVLLVTDHGRDAKGKGHGNQTLSEKTIFIGMNIKGNSFFESINNDSSINTIKELEKVAIPQTAIVPTILKYLGIPILKEWHLDSKSLIE